jgi:pyruvate dehydrogenase E2 component (dihydrolipoamide acetyltransferase)
MSYKTKFLLPRLGDGDSGGRVVSRLKNPGDAFVKDEPLLEVETDKAIVEVPATSNGVLIDWVVNVDDAVEYRSAVAEVEFEGEAPTQVVVEQAAPVIPDPVVRAPVAQSVPVASGEQRERIFATPRARRLAADLAVDLRRLNGSGKGGRIVRDDVLAARGTLAAPGDSRLVGAESTVDGGEQAISTPHGEIFVKSWRPKAPRTDASVVLVHGLFGDVETWAATATSLYRAGIPVLAFDLPCHGRSESTVTGIDEISALLGNVIHAMVSGPVVLVGHSFGAAVAARAARAQNLGLRALVLISPVGLGTQIEQGFLDGMTHAGSLEALSREMRKLTLRAPPAGGAYLSLLHQRLSARSASLVAMCRGVSWNGVQQVDITPDLAEVLAPVAIIQGRQDAILPWAHALNAPPRVALHLVPQAGHMPQWEASELTMEVIIRAAGL